MQRNNAMTRFLRGKGVGNTDSLSALRSILRQKMGLAQPKPFPWRSRHARQQKQQKERSKSPSEARFVDGQGETITPMRKRPQKPNADVLQAWPP